MSTALESARALIATHCLYLSRPNDRLTRREKKREKERDELWRRLSELELGRKGAGAALQGNSTNSASKA